MNVSKNDKRLTTFPISPNRQKIWDMYVKAYRSFWVVEEISLTKDKTDWNNLNDAERKFLEYVLAFFAASDGIVNLNIVERFQKEIPILEVNYFYSFQVAIENIHAQMYSLLLETLIEDSSKRQKLLNAIETIPIVKKMSEFMFDCINSDAPFGERLLRMACVEGIFFTGCFCVIYWLQNRGLMPGLGHSNELIARDEALHTQFTLLLYNELTNGTLFTKNNPKDIINRKTIEKIFTNAVDLAKEFICEALPFNLPEMNSKLMCDYIECQADNLLQMINEKKIYNAQHKFHFMEQINLDNRTNFFDRRVSEYSKTNCADNDDFEIAEDF